MDYTQLKPKLISESLMLDTPVRGASDYDSYQLSGVTDVLEIASGPKATWWDDLNNSSYTEGTDYFVYTPKWIFCRKDVAILLKLQLQSYTLQHYPF